MSALDNINDLFVGTRSVRTVESKSGSTVFGSGAERTVEEPKIVTMTNEVAIALLASNMSLIPARDQSFASSLVSQWRQRGSLSAKQWPHVVRFGTVVRDALAGVKTTTVMHATLNTTSDVNLTPIVDLFNNVRNIKWPRLRFEDEHGEFILIRVGDRGMEPGSIVIKRDGEVAARIARNGTTNATGRMLEILKSFATNPTEFAKLEGRRTGICCCCGRELTNAESIELGIGPICLGNWGL